MACRYQVWPGRARHGLRARRDRDGSRRRKFIAQFVLEFAVVIAEIDRADAARGGADQQPAERRLGDREADFGAPAALGVSRRGHAKARAAGFIDPARGAVAGAVGRPRHAFAGTQAVAQRLAPQAIGKGARTDPQLRLEPLLQMARAEAGCLAEVDEGRKTALAVGPARRLDQRHRAQHRLLGSLGGIGSALSTGAETGGARTGGVGEKRTRSRRGRRLEHPGRQ